MPESLTCFHDAPAALVPPGGAIARLVLVRLAEFTTFSADLKER